MPVTTSISGRASDYKIELRNADGCLLYQESSVMFPELPPPPAPPTCYAGECIERYKVEVDAWAAECKAKAEFYRFIHAYHRARSEYCQRHRNEAIEERYRTGIPAPDSIQEIKSEIKKLRG